jgi:hypothetical protein
MVPLTLTLTDLHPVHQSCQLLDSTSVLHDIQPECGAEVQVSGRARGSGSISHIAKKTKNNPEPQCGLVVLTHRLLPFSVVPGIMGQSLTHAALCPIPAWSLHPLTGWVSPSAVVSTCCVHVGSGTGKWTGGTYIPVPITGLGL